ncbi:MAG TPA: response regulator [Clostridia bacterium]
MMKIVFIDDESITLKLLTNILDWNSIGFEIAGTALNGIEGLSLCESVNPDVAIVDIKMPQMDGLEFIHELRKRNEDISLIVLSAYDEFEYAQKAIPYGISAYLLKPLDEGSLVKVLKEIKEASAARKNEKERMLRLQNEKDMINLELEFRKYLDAVRSGLKNEYRGMMLESYGRLMALFKNYYTVLIRFPRDACKKADPAPLTAAIRDLKTSLEKQLEMNVFATDNNPYEYTLVLSSKLEDRPPAEVSEIKCFFEEYIESVLTDTECVIGLSDLTHSAGKLKFAYDQAKLAASLAFYQDKKSVYGYDELGQYSLLSEKYLIAIEQDIYDCVHTINMSVLSMLISQSFKYFHDHRVLPVHVYDFCIKLFQIFIREILKTYDNFNIQSFLHLEEADFHIHYNERLLRQFMEEDLANVMEQLKVYIENNRNMSLVQKANLYADSHFTKKDFSVQEVSDYIGVSKNHFSKIYKEQTGINFWDYVTKKRINMAKRLLKETNKTNYEISHMIGYESEYHFSRKFKEIMGMSPAAFRKA